MSVGRKKKILFVEDTPIFREPIAACLEQHGFNVVCAINGRDALQKVETQVRPFDLMLIDVAMPEMDGLTLLGNIRRMPKSEKTPVFMLTAAAEKDFVIKARTFGVEEYLIKSQFSLDDLLARIRRYI